MSNTTKNEFDVKKKETKNWEIIRQIYIMSGLTQKQLSQITGIKMNTIACWVAGRRNPPDYTVDLFRAKIAQYEQSLEKTESEGE